MSEYKEPMELDEAYKLADALYAAGYKDRHNERDYDPRKCPEWQAVVDPLIEQAAPETAADWLNTILWMYRRLPQAYGRPPFIEQSIKTLAKQVGQDVTHELRERVVRTAVHEHGARQAAPAVPYRVAEFWSSATAGKKVRMLAEGADIVEWAKRDDFIRWVDAPPVAAPEAPAGYRLVPIEPTPAMYDAAGRAVSGNWRPSDAGKSLVIYKAMIEAAPETPASTAPAKPAYTRTDAMLAFSAMCDTSLITRPAAEAMRDTLCAAVEQPAPGQQAPVAQPDRIADTMDHAQLQALGCHRGPP